MAVAREISLLLIGLFVLCAFSLQASACFIERAGVVACQEHHDDQSAGEGATIDCCHVESGANFPSVGVDAPLFRVISLDLGPVRSAPDAPVAEIEYPPQLLS